MLTQIFTHFMILVFGVAADRLMLRRREPALRISAASKEGAYHLSPPGEAPQERDQRVFAVVKNCGGMEANGCSGKIDVHLAEVGKMPVRKRLLSHDSQWRDERIFVDIPRGGDAELLLCTVNSQKHHLIFTQAEPDAAGRFEVFRRIFPLTELSPTHELHLAVKVTGSASTRPGTRTFRLRVVGKQLLVTQFNPRWPRAARWIGEKLSTAWSHGIVGGLEDQLRVT